MKGSSRSAGELHQIILGVFVSACICPACCFDAAMVSKCLLTEPGEEHTCDSGCSCTWSDATCHLQRGEPDSVEC